MYKHMKFLNKINLEGVKNKQIKIT
jgi:hypothetical protein